MNVHDKYPLTVTILPGTRPRLRKGTPLINGNTPIIPCVVVRGAIPTDLNLIYPT